MEDEKISPFRLHEIAKGDKDVYLKLMALHGHIILKNKCKKCEGTGQMKHSNNPNLIGSIQCFYCGGTGKDDNKQLCSNDDKRTNHALVPLDKEKIWVLLNRILIGEFKSDERYIGSEANAYIAQEIVSTFGRPAPKSVEEIEAEIHNAYFKSKELLSSNSALLIKDYAQAVHRLVYGEKK